MEESVQVEGENNVYVDRKTIGGVILRSIGNLNLVAAAERPSSLLGLVGSVGSGSPEYSYVHGMVMREKKERCKTDERVSWRSPCSAAIL